ncbi:MAG: phage major capsid protein [Rhodoferax sp.]|uniref:phage major capsid protein n=1 Tax=Rhodoferax sp. TaxID=50421 RepID=UPI001B403CAE|nr:phage major capsid protein [Rhodoferax sp.]MBP8285881.1 phage major capsid protein [Rhodoferax sp.]MBP9734310.1 phage major capsid protein [Rhodoferax sp.]
MEKFSPTLDRQAGHKHWSAMCAKIGASDAAIFSPGDSMSDLHQQRKAVRKAIAQYVDRNDSESLTANESLGLEFAGDVVARINGLMESYGNHSKSENNQSLHGVGPITNHYRNKSKSGQFGLQDYLRGIGGGNAPGDVRAALSEGTDTSGGYAVPSFLMPGILEALVPASALLTAGAGIVPLDDGAKSYTTAAVDSIPTAAWRAEAGALAVSDPAFRAVVATPRSLSFMFKVSRELLMDGQGIEQALNTAIGQAFAKELDRAGLRGSGAVPEPRGILNTSGIQAVTNLPNGLALSGYGLIFSAIQKILEANAPMPTSCIMSPRSLVDFASTVDSTGQPMNVPTMVQGLKMIGTSQIPNNLTVGTSSDCTEIYVADFSQMFFAMRESVSIQKLNELYAASGEIGFACHVRADVVLKYPAAFALVTGVRP